MTATVETETRKLLKLLTAAGFEANVKCENPICRQMAKVERNLTKTVTVGAHQNGKG